MSWKQKLLPDKSVIIFFKLFAIFILLAVGYEAYDDGRKKEKLQSEKASIGMHASMAGSLFASAIRQCELIGYSVEKDMFERCEMHTGPLLHDKTAPEIAKLARKQAVDYYDKCNKHYSNDYCSDLINRALVIAQREKEN